MEEKNRFQKNIQPVEDLLASRQKSFAAPNTMEYVSQDLQNKSESLANNILQERNDLAQSVSSVFGSNKQQKFGLTETVDFDQVYTQIGDEFIPKYKNFLKGTDNNERLAQQQSTGSKWANGLKKAGINIGTTVLGSTIGFGTSIASWISSGFDSQAYINDDFNKSLDRLNEKMRYKLPNYYTKQEQDLSFGQSLGTANFWANDVAGGLSFTIGTLVSEGIWAAATGGASLATSAARWSLRASKLGKLTKGINKFINIGKQPLKAGFKANQAAKKAKGTANVADLLNTARFTMTSAGYEAGVEARHFMKEAEENFEFYYEQNFGRKPTQEEYRDFKKDLTTAGNSLYASNLALIGASNLAIFGKMFKVKTPLAQSFSKATKGAKESINKTLFGAGTKTTKEGGKFARKALKPNIFQKTAGITNAVVKAPIIEGAWEEGNQSVFSNTAESFVSSGYDPEATNDSFNLMEGVYDSFSETYGSKEGWKEVGIGMIIGLFGGGVSGQWTSYSKQLKQQKAIAEASTGEAGTQATIDKILKDASFGSNIVADKVKASNKIIAANKAEQQAETNGDVTAAQLARKRSIMANLELNKKYDRLDESFDDFKTAMELIDNETLAEETGIDETEIQDYKKEVLSEYKKLSDEYSDNRDFADLILGRGETTKDLKNKEEVANAIAYNMTMGKESAKNAQMFLDEMNIEFAKFVNPEKSSEIKTALDARKILDTAKKENREKLFKLKNKREETKKKRENLDKEILNLNKKLQNLSTEKTEEKQKTQQKLTDYAQQIEELNTLEETLTQELDTVVKLIDNNSPFKNEEGELLQEITVDSLDKSLELDKTGNIVGGSLAEIDSLIEAQEDINPNRANRIKKMFSEYQKSVYALKKYNETIKGISNENFKPKNFATKLEQKIAGLTKKEANEFTKEFFANVGLQIQKDTLELIQKEEKSDVVNTEVKASYESEYNKGDYRKLLNAVRTTLNPNKKGTKEDLQMFKNYPKLTEVLIKLEGKRQSEKRKILQNVDKDFLLTKPQKNSYVEKRGKEIDEKYDKILDSIFEKDNLEKETELQRLKRVADQTTKENNSVSEYIGENVEEAEENKPTKKDISRLRELTQKLQGTKYANNIEEYFEHEEEMPITKEEFEDLQNLNEKLGNWQVMEGTMVLGLNSSLADIIHRIVQLNTQIENNTKQTQEKQDYIEISEVSEKNSGATRNDVRTIQTLNGVYIQFGKGNKVSLSHVNVDTLLGRYMKDVTKVQIQKPNSKKKVDIDIDKINEYQKQEGLKFFVTVGEKVVPFEIGQNKRIFFDKKVWSEIKDSLSLKFLTEQETDPQAKNNSFVMGYEVLEDGSVRPAISDFTVDNGLEKLTAEELKSLNKVYAYLDPKDSYNKKLLDKYNKAVKANNEKKIEEARQELEANVGISLLNNNKFAGFLRAGLENNSSSDTSVMYAQLRKQAAQQLIEAQDNNLINLKVTIPINFMFNGSPVFNLAEQDAEVTVQDKEIGQQELSLIKDAGYVQNGNLFIGGKVAEDSVNKKYLPNNSKKTPVMVFNYNGENVAFVLNLKSAQIDKSNKLFEIENSSLTLGQKINAINDLLIQNKIEPSKFNLNETNYSSQFENVENALKEVESLPSVESWAKKDFNLNDLSLQATSPLDITNNPFNSPKVVMDVKNSKTTQPQDVREDVEDTASNILDEIVEYGKIIDNSRGKYKRKDGSVVEDTNFTDVLDDDVLERNPKNWTNKVANLNKIRKLFEKPIPPTINNYHGKGFFKELKNKIKKYDTLNKKRRDLSKEVKDKARAKQNQEC